MRNVVPLHLHCDRYMQIKRLFILIVVCWGIGCNLAWAQYRVHGMVTDSLSGEAIPFASVYMMQTQTGAQTDVDGKFAFVVNQKQGALTISFVGYKTHTVSLSFPLKKTLNVRLVPESYKLSEVVVKPGRERYKKDNPAVRFVREMMDRKDANSPYEKDYFIRDRHEKTILALNNFTPEQQQKWLYRKFDFLKDYVDTAIVTGRPILPVSMRERLATDLYQKSPRVEKQYVKARQQHGIDDMLPKESLEMMLAEVFQDIDIYEPNIALFTNRFVSPLSSFGPSFYKYYLNDTTWVGGERCVDLTFVPFNSESFGFTGHLYVTVDSTYFVKRVVLNLPEKINLNFVNFLQIDQEFERSSSDMTRLLSHEYITADLIGEEGSGVYARREVTYANHSFIPTDEQLAMYERPERIIESSDALSKEDEFWAENRLGEITPNENSVKNLMSQLRDNPIYYWTEKVLKILFTGYIPTSEKAPKFYYGPMNATISGNTLEGVRLRAGGMTSAHLNPHLFLRGFMAYGLQDQKMKYLAELEYSFDPKKEYANEFPIHSLRWHSEYDVNQYGQHYMYTNKDNVFLMLKRKPNDQLGYEAKHQLIYTHEYHSNFSWKAIARYHKYEATHLIPFERQLKMGGTELFNSINTSELELQLRYAPGEKFVQTQWNRYRVSRDKPIFGLTHTLGVKGLFGGDYTFNHTEASIQTRFWFSAFGYTDIILKAGKVWDKVPFPLLIIPNANLSYTIQPEAYALMTPLEFVTDQYCSWDVSYYLNGWLFNRLPLIKKLKWREVLTCRGFWGDLSAKNLPTPTNGLPLFPSGSGVMSHSPYVEMGVGIENIFKVLRIDYVRRLTYRGNLNGDDDGIRISLHMTF